MRLTLEIVQVDGKEDTDLCKEEERLDASLVRAATIPGNIAEVVLFEPERRREDFSRSQQKARKAELRSVSMNKAPIFCNGLQGAPLCLTCR